MEDFFRFFDAFLCSPLVKSVFLLSILLFFLCLFFQLLDGSSKLLSFFDYLDYKFEVRRRSKNIKKLRVQRELLDAILRMEDEGIKIDLDTFKHYGLMDEYNRRLKVQEDILKEARKNAIAQLKSNGLLTHK